MTRGDGGKSPDMDGGMTLGTAAGREDGDAIAGADGTTPLDATGVVTWGTTAGGNGTATCGGVKGCSADFGNAGTIGTGGAALETNGAGTRGGVAAPLLATVGATGNESGLRPKLSTSLCLTCPSTPGPLAISRRGVTIRPSLARGRGAGRTR